MRFFVSHYVDSKKRAERAKRWTAIIEHRSGKVTSIAGFAGSAERRRQRWRGMRPRRNPARATRRRPQLVKARFLMIPLVGIATRSDRPDGDVSKECWPRGGKVRDKVILIAAGGGSVQDDRIVITCGEAFERFTARARTVFPGRRAAVDEKRSRRCGRKGHRSVRAGVAALLALVYEAPGGGFEEVEPQEVTGFSVLSRFASERAYLMA